MLLRRLETPRAHPEAVWLQLKQNNEAPNIRPRSSVSFACQVQREVHRLAFKERITTV